MRVPLINASPQTLRDRIEELVELGADGREELGRSSRAYVERVHDLERVTDQMLDLYAAVGQPDARRRREAVRAVATRSPLAPARPQPVQIDDPDLDTGIPAAVTPPPAAGADAPGRARQAAPPARQALCDLRDRRARLAGDRGAPAADLHPLPEPDRLRSDRDAARPHDGDGSHPPRRHHERVLPVLLRRRRQRGPHPRPAHLVLVHDGLGDTRAGAPARVRRPGLDGPVRHGLRCRPRACVGGRALGDRQLRAADGALPGRGAVGGLRDREPRQHLPHDRHDAAARRHVRQGADRRDRRQLHGNARRVPRAARIPARAARTGVRPRPSPRDEPLRDPARSRQRSSSGSRTSATGSSSSSWTAWPRPASTRSACASPRRWCCC